ncbi:MAG: RNA methyltransferase [Acidobacteriota bacterium]|nr:RNA methyltransferase [Acidobacteriota bacterium]
MTHRPAPSVILVRPTEPGNIGAVARAMANTGLTDLLLIDPAPPIDGTARAFAVGAGHILDTARRFDSLATAAGFFQQIIGTSSQRSRAPKVPLLTPRQLAAQFAVAPQPRTALLFGPERSGLTTDELARCNILVTIPASRRQPTLNLSQAVLIVAHEIFAASYRAADAVTILPDRARIADVESFLEALRTLLGRIGFSRDDTFHSVFLDLRRLALRAELSSREVMILRGVLRRAEHRLAAVDSANASSKDNPAE